LATADGQILPEAAMPCSKVQLHLVIDAGERPCQCDQSNPSSTLSSSSPSG